MGVVVLLALIGAVPTIDVDERRPLALLFDVPEASSSNTSVSELLRLTEGVLEARTDLRPQNVDAQAYARRCRGSIACIVRGVRADFERPAGGDAPRHLVYLRLVAPEEKGGQDHLVALLVDTEKVAEIYRRVPSDARDRERVIESKVKETLTVATSYLQATASQSDLQKFIDALFMVHFRSPLEREGHFEPRAKVRLEVSFVGATISIDGRPVGLSAEGPLLISGLRPGERVLSVAHPDLEPASATVRLVPGQVESVKLAVEKKPDPVRSVVIWSGAGVAAAGSAVAIASLVVGAGSKPTHFCVSPDTAACASGALLSLPNETADTTGRSGVLLAPLGLGLLSAGGATALTTWLWGEDLPLWSTVLIGVGAGALTYGVGALANPAP